MRMQIEFEGFLFIQGDSALVVRDAKTGEWLDWRKFRWGHKPENEAQFRAAISEWLHP